MYINQQKIISVIFNKIVQLIYMMLLIKENIFLMKEGDKKCVIKWGHRNLINSWIFRAWTRW